MSTPDYVTGTFALSTCTMGQILSALANSKVETAKVNRAMTIHELKARGYTHLALEWRGPGYSKISRLILWPKKGQQP